MKQACVHVRVGMVCPSGPACEVPAPPSARGVRLASGRLTRSGRRHGGTESGFEVGLRAVSSTWSPPWKGIFYHGTHGNALRATQKRPGKKVLRTIRLLFTMQRHLQNHRDCGRDKRVHP